jgi:CheY-like chemotaxis protein
VRNFVVDQSAPLIAVVEDDPDLLALLGLGLSSAGYRCLAIDDGLLEEALKLGGHRTKKATVTEALREYIRRRKQLEIVELFGTIEFDEGVRSLERSKK